MLAGQASDPLLGDIEADAYLDFFDAGSFGQGNLARFRTGTVTGAYLELSRAYVYGDTLSDVGYSLSPITTEFSQVGAPSDTSFATGSPITTFTYTPSDSLVRIPLPAAWVAANDTTLRSALFSTSFHGFRISATSGNAVIGYRPASARLFATTAQDTVSFAGSKAVSATRRATPPNLPAGYILLQDGFPNSYRVDFDLDTVAVRGGALSRVVLELAYDSLLQQQAPPHFVRPMLSRVELAGIDSDGDVLLTSNSSSVPCDNALACVQARPLNGRVLLTGRVFSVFLQSLLLGDASAIEGAYVRVPQELGTLNVLLLRAPGTASAPTLALTTVSTE